MGGRSSTHLPVGSSVHGPGRQECSCNEASLPRSRHGARYRQLPRVADGLLGQRGHELDNQAAFKGRPVPPRPGHHSPL